MKVNLSNTNLSGLTELVVIDLTNMFHAKTFLRDYFVNNCQF